MSEAPGIAKPVVFISYANEQTGRSKAFAIQLRDDLKSICGFNASVADFDNGPGNPVNDYGVGMAWQADWIVCVCTPEYVEKSRKGSTARLRPEFEAINVP